MSRLLIPRRSVLLAGAGLLVAGCDRISRAPTARSILGVGETATRTVQRGLLSAQPLAREFSERDLSRVFKANGSTLPSDPAYAALMADNFAGYRLQIDGMVRHPLSLSLADIRRDYTKRTQITRHDCVEGWSCIGKWAGVPLADIMLRAGLADGARYLVFHCADDLGPATANGARYYESIDLFDAFHPQTILAYEMNGAPLPVAHGAPLRLRVERQLGYKQAKFVMRIEAVARFDNMRGGKGGYWEDRGYEWYGGI